MFFTDHAVLITVIHHMLVIYQVSVVIKWLKLFKNVSSSVFSFSATVKKRGVLRH